MSLLIHARTVLGLALVIVSPLLLEKQAYAQYQSNRTISGTVQLDAPTDLHAIVTQDVWNEEIQFEFRTLAGTYLFTRHLPLKTLSLNGGQFTLTGIPANTYRVGIKGNKWLRKIIDVDCTQGDVSTVSVLLPTGDATDDNMVDITDYGIVVSSSGSYYLDSNTNYDHQADFNCDGHVDLGDVGLIVNSYGLFGDEFFTMNWISPASTTYPAPLPGFPGGQPIFCRLHIDIDDNFAPSTPPTLQCSIPATDTHPGAIMLGNMPVGISGVTLPNWDAAGDCYFTLIPSTANFAGKITLTASYHDDYNNSARAKTDIVLLPTNLWVSSIEMPNKVQLSWDVYTADNTYYVRRIIGTTIVDSPTLVNVQTYTDTFDFTSGTACTYELHASNGLLLRTEKVTLYKVGASENQAVDSRIDPRYGNSAPFLDFPFGNRTFKGGLFVGYAQDESKVGRSFSKFDFSASQYAVPASKTFRAGSANAYFTQTAPGNNVNVFCNVVTNTSDSYVNSWTRDDLVWTKSQALITNADIYAFPAVVFKSSADTDPSPPGWATWNMGSALRSLLYGETNTHLLSTFWAADWDTSDSGLKQPVPGWAYFAKKEYKDHSYGPTIAYALSSPVPRSVAEKSVFPLASQRN